MAPGGVNRELGIPGEFGEIGAGILMGTDKWEHFFQQGYWLWDLAYGDAMASGRKWDRSD